MVDENVSVVGVQAHVSGGFQPSVGSLLNKALHDGTRLGVLGRGGRGALEDLLLSARKDRVWPPEDRGRLKDLLSELAAVMVTSELRPN